MSNAPSASTHFVTVNSVVVRPFYVVVTESLISAAPSQHHFLDLHKGDIFICTHYNKIGRWWGVSVYDLTRQGWFPSSLVQPYDGEVPEEASELFKCIKENWLKSSTDGVSHDRIDEPIKYNIVTNDGDKYQEYDTVGVVQRVGRTTRVTDKTTEIDKVETEDFDYETWALARNQKSSNSSSSTVKRSRQN